jgi:hypothetical protein
MAELRLICTACGCHLEAEPGTTAESATCPACGKRVRLDQHAPRDGDATEQPPPASSPPPSTRARPKTSRRPPAVPLAVAAAAAAIVIAAVWFGRAKDEPQQAKGPAQVASAPPAASTAPAEPWDHAHRGELMRMKSDADDLAIAGDLRGAYDGYKRLLTTAAAHDVADPESMRIVADARTAQGKLFDALVASRSNAVAAAVAPTTLPAAQGARSSDRDRRAALAQMLSAADRLAVAGDLAGARSAYRQMLAAAGPLATADPAVADMAEAARRNEAMVGARLRPGRGATPAPPVATVPPAPQGVAAAPAPANTPDGVRQAADAAPVLATVPPPPSLRTYVQPNGVTDEQIGTAINRAIDNLRPNVLGFGPPVAAANPPAPVVRQPVAPTPPGIRPGRNWQPPARALTDDGPTVLIAYALVNAGRATDRPGLRLGDPATAQLLDRVRAMSLSWTYCRSLRAATLAVHARMEDRTCLEDDVRWLIAAQHDGGYTYRMPADTAWAYDNSNSQYGLLGVWSGAQAGVAVPDSYWQDVNKHWVWCAHKDGQWGYRAGTPPYLSMTLAGVASLLVAHQYLDADGAGNGPVRAPVPIINAGLDWIARGDNCLHNPAAFASYDAYTHYGLERVGLATGFKYFGTHDWYNEVGGELVGTQQPDGSWNGSAIDTSYDLLFLARGRAPLLFNKLRYNGDWANRPYDVANLAHVATTQLERPLNWQAVDLGRPWSDWTDAPVLYISGDAGPNMSDADVAALRDYALAGGLIVTHADGGSPAFTAWAHAFVRKAFPKYELTRVPKDHPLATALFHLKNAPPLEAVDNGSRLLMVHCPTDVAGGWRPGGTQGGSPELQLGLNLFVYAAGKTSYRNRLDPTFVPPPPGGQAVTIPVARLKFAGEWDPEPYAWTRFSRAFAWDTQQALDVRAVELKDLKPGQVPAAFLTGTFRQDFTLAEVAAAKAYVEAGGVLVVDACGGQERFAKSVRSTLLSAAFPGAPVGPLPADHPVLLPSRPFAEDLRSMRLRPFASEKLNVRTVPLEGLHAGQGWVIFSPLDLTSGLLGTQEWGILGYDPAYASALVRNAVLWAAARSGFGVAAAAGPAAVPAAVAPAAAAPAPVTPAVAAQAGIVPVTVSALVAAQGAFFVPLPPPPSPAEVKATLTRLAMGSPKEQSEAVYRLGWLTPEDADRPVVLAALAPLMASPADPRWTGAAMAYVNWVDAGELGRVRSLLAMSDGVPDGPGKPRAEAALCAALLRLDRPAGLAAINARVVPEGFRGQLIFELQRLSRHDDGAEVDWVIVQLQRYRDGMKITGEP